jgi:hypothetical protein
VSTEATRNIALSIPDLGVLFRSVLTQGNPRLAEKIPPRVRGVVAEFDQGKAAGTVVSVLRLSKRLVGFAALLIGLGLACIAGAFGLTRDRRRALADLSVHLIAAGVVLLVLRAAGGWFLRSLGADALAHEALAAVWAALTVGIRGWALTLALVGIVTAASAHSLFGRMTVAEALTGAWRFAQTPPAGVWGSLARSVVLAVVGGAAVVYPRQAVEWMMLGVGGACAFVGVREALVLLQGSQGSVVQGAAARARGAGVRRVAVIGVATTLLAVDFYRTGDLVKVVAELNR